MPVYRYLHQTGEHAGDYYEGVPGRDLTADEFERLTDEQKAAVVSTVPYALYDEIEEEDDASERHEDAPVDVAGPDGWGEGMDRTVEPMNGQEGRSDAAEGTEDGHIVATTPEAPIAPIDATDEPLPTDDTPDTGV